MLADSIDLLSQLLDAVSVLCEHKHPYPWQSVEEHVKAEERWYVQRDDLRDNFVNLFSAIRLWIRDGLPGESFDRALVEVDEAERSISALIRLEPPPLLFATCVHPDGREELQYVIRDNDRRPVVSIIQNAQNAAYRLMRWRDLVRPAAPPGDARDVVDTRQLCNFARVTRQTINKWVKEGKLPAPHIPNTRPGTANCWFWSKLIEPLSKLVPFPVPEIFPGNI